MFWLCSCVLDLACGMCCMKSTTGHRPLTGGRTAAHHRHHQSDCDENGKHKSCSITRESCWREALEVTDLYSLLPSEHTPCRQQIRAHTKQRKWVTTTSLTTPLVHGHAPPQLSLLSSLSTHVRLMLRTPRQHAWLALLAGNATQLPERNAACLHGQDRWAARAISKHLQ